MTLLAQSRKAHLWFRQLFFWAIWEPRFLWFAMLVIVVAILFISKKGFSEPAIRITGLTLQLFGIYTVAWGIIETRKLFDRPSIFMHIRTWLDRRPIFGGRVIVADMSARLGGFGVIARGSISAGVGPNATVEERMRALETNIDLLGERISHVETEMDNKFRAHAQTLMEEQLARASKDEIITAKLEATETGGLHISAMGVLWLFVGVIMSTASQEIAKWLV